MSFLRTTVKMKENEKRDKYLDLARELKKAVEREGDDDTNTNWHTWNSPQRLGKGTERVETERKNRDHPDYSSVEIGQNSERSPGDPRRFAVTQTPVKDYQLMLVWKNLQRVL